jgi:ankyrin repeat protein
MCLAAVLVAYLWPRGPRDHGGQPANADDEGGLFAAVERGDVEAAADVLAADSTVVNEPVGPAEPDRPLNRAAARGDKAMVDLLLHYGAEVNARGAAGSTPLHDAVRGDHFAVASRLLRAGVNANARDDAGTTPLLLAVRLPGVSVARLLLEYGARPDAAGGPGKPITPIEAAEGAPAGGAMTDLLRTHGAR